MKKTALAFVLLALPLCMSAEDLSDCMRAWGLTQSGNYPQALGLYDACIRTGDLSAASLARTYRNIGITYRRAGEPRKAVQAYDKAIALHPDDVVSDYINRGNAHDEAGDFAAAMADYARALQLRPDSGDAYYNRGVSYEHFHMPAQAKADFIAAYDHGLRTALLHERFVVYGLADKWQP